MTEKPHITMGSLFDGIGGFPLSAMRNGITPVWASEIEKFPMEVTKAHFPKMQHMGDITKLNGADLPPVDIICGGSPCQDLSVAGARAGLSGARSGLFIEQIRIVREMRERYGAAKPRYMVWENVPGAFSSGKPKGEDFRVVLEEICRIKSDTVSLPRPVGEHGLMPGELFWEMCSPYAGECWMLNTGVSPSEDAESSLSQILQEQAPSKYYLSAAACAGILRRAKERGKALPERLRQALIRQMEE